MKWSLQQALNLSSKEVQEAEIRAFRIERDAEPDGAIDYIPHTQLYASRKYLSRKTLRYMLDEARSTKSLPQMYS